MKRAQHGCNAGALLLVLAAAGCASERTTGDDGTGSGSADGGGTTNSHSDEGSSGTSDPGASDSGTSSGSSGTEEPCTAPPCYGPPTLYPVGPAAQWASGADVDGDGALDLLVTNGTITRASVLFGRTDGTFDPQIPLRVGDNATWMLSIDINGDDRLDLVTATFSLHGITTRLNLGDRSFARATTSPLPIEGAIDAAAADLDGSGLVEIVSAGFGTGAFPEAHVLATEGDGTLSVVATYPLIEMPSAVALGDIDGDDNIDAVVALDGLFVAEVLLGQGDRTFVAGEPAYVDETVRDIALGDIDADGVLDLVALDGSDGELRVVTGKGDGTFAAPVGYAVGQMYPTGVAIADLELDGDVDVVIAAPDTGELLLMLNEGDGTLAEPRAVGGLPICLFPLVEDFDGDSLPDLACAQGDEATIGVALSTGRTGDPDEPVDCERHLTEELCDAAGCGGLARVSWIEDPVACELSHWDDVCVPDGGAGTSPTSFHRSLDGDRVFVEVGTCAADPSIDPVGGEWAECTDAPGAPAACACLCAAGYCPGESDVEQMLTCNLPEPCPVLHVGIESVNEDDARCMLDALRDGSPAHLQLEGNWFETRGVDELFLRGDGTAFFSSVTEDVNSDDCPSYGPAFDLCSLQDTAFFDACEAELGTVPMPECLDSAHAWVTGCSPSSPECP